MDSSDTLAPSLTFVDEHIWHSLAHIIPSLSPTTPLSSWPVPHIPPCILLARITYIRACSRRGSCGQTGIEYLNPLAQSLQFQALSFRTHAACLLCGVVGVPSEPCVCVSVHMPSSPCRLARLPVVTGDAAFRLSSLRESDCCGT
ncbi:hypothetical protein PYCCODRAFT_573284 [Trametes coccinea BRFM310]|uniref:Uncharacterized protein n=1 Tax=Trametes coccinea (strain BRFM310) TaxID=1353009 RepID=A0A1Y2IKB1_TRAC3|nr:hypothetical protein PYCCODRAFT_573284 [Trametes coccinea BRFM310]